MRESKRRDRMVQRMIILEGIANIIVFGGKLAVGLTTGSLAVIGDAIHSLTDVANNIVAWAVVKFSSQPADDNHPYGHRKFETLAVFGLAVLLAVFALELALHAIRREPTEITVSGWALAVMIGVLFVNIGISGWQWYWGKKLNSHILTADAHHTFSDVLTTVVVIVGWQLSARGYPWLDTVCALGVAGLVLYLAFSLFMQSLPSLVDESAIEPDDLTRAIKEVPGIRQVGQVRSRWVGANPAIDVVVFVDPNLSTKASHDIADAVEDRLEQRFAATDISIHIEPHGHA